jgi:N-acetylmuramic acid 6-phosphate etherase
MADQSPTEAILESTRDMDQWSAERIVQAIHGEDARAWEAVGAVLPRVVEAAEVLTVALSGGGRWFNVGAGTSGRIGALDAAEIPPTFGLPHQRVQAVVAGGDAALVRAIEGAEDHSERAVFALQERGLRAGDVVVAISASGCTPFTLGSLDAAHEVGARTIGITCNPRSPLAEAAEIAIVPVVGPEVIAGSTRMKGGLAQKMVLNLLSTTVMVRLGYVDGNLMTHMIPASEKLRERGVRIVMSLGGLDRAAAAKLLADCEGNVAEATRILNLKRSRARVG